MKVSELMTPAPRAVSPDDSVRRAAELMEQLDVGVLPVCDDDRLVGIITDRDITVRSTALGSPPDSTNVSEVMTETVRCVSPEDEVTAAEQLMSSAQIRRVAVVDADKRLIGILSLGDLALRRDAGVTVVLEKISQPRHRSP